ncbi:MAG: hypothetical protein DRP94_04570 [Candidatus Latescibacterota bacterium]|nr:MAG: hypothetical protein DRP94_04570 [Candidatus Latescibacterota bacterium]
MRASIAFVAVLAMVAVASAGENEGAIVSMMKPVETTFLHPGDVVTVEVYGSGLVNAKGFSVVLEYDTDRLVYVDGSFDYSGGLFDGAISPGAAAIGNTVEIGAAFLTGGASGDGLLGKLQFKVSDGATSGDSFIKVNLAKFLNQDGTKDEWRPPRLVATLVKVRLVAAEEATWGEVKARMR